MFDFLNRNVSNKVIEQRPGGFAEAELAPPPPRPSLPPRAYGLLPPRHLKHSPLVGGGEAAAAAGASGGQRRQAAREKEEQGDRGAAAGQARQQAARVPRAGLLPRLHAIVL
jgi:hypothetical protein